ncbi:hypothetical protein BGX34_003277 [Mortierella sp. NVP85]|nr:hypothetical protein BGX34_003277 [Mortierella sp. NVP85]
MGSTLVANDITKVEAANSQTVHTAKNHDASASTAQPALSRKASTPALRTTRRMSRSNLASNATTAWTVGQQQTNNLPSNGPSNAPSNGPSEHSSQSADAKSKFMRAIGKFKHKHLPQKKTGAESVASNNSPLNTPNDSEHNATSDSNRSSVVLPPPFHNDLSITSADLGSSAPPAISDSASVSMRSYVEVAPKENSGQLQLHDIDMDDSDARRNHSHDDHSAPSSLRVKFKNRVHTTLASFKSTSSLREKARSQQAAYLTPLSTPISASVSAPSSPLDPHPSPSDLTPPQLRPSSAYVSSSSDTTQRNSMLRLSKPFWTLPRVRPESSSSSGKLMPWISNSRRGSMTDKSSLKPHQPDLDTVMISPELAPLPYEQHAGGQSDDDSDSDESIDIIMPVDYKDYTQFAELPLKQRKKLEAAAAAGQDPTGKRSSAMKRFLMAHKAADDKKKAHEEGHDAANHSIPQRSSKKRPKDQDSIEQKQQQMSNKMAKSNAEEPSEWRKAIIKSLHLGKVSKKSKGSSANSPVEPLAPQAEQENPHGLFQNQQTIVRPKRTDSISSNRSRSMDTSTHPALLATTMGPQGSRRETLEMAIHRRRRSSAVRSGAQPAYPGAEDETASMHVTHTFTSFTLELADVQHAQAVVNNSAVPGLFNFKRVPRSIQYVDTNQEFKGFDSDGDMSGYTGDADISMEEISLRPRTPIGLRAIEGRDKGKHGEVAPSEYLVRRRSSYGGDADTDTLPELPKLSARRELNRSGSGGRSSSNSKSVDTSGRETPKLHRRTPSTTTTTTTSPTLVRKSSRNLLNGQANASSSSTTEQAPSEETSGPFKAKSGSRPILPALNTKGLSVNRGSAAAVTVANGLEVPPHRFHPQHQRQLSSSAHHQQQSSGDTLLPNHLKHFSTASTLSASSTLNGHNPLTLQVKEFDPNRDFDPETPVDLKTMDFDTLLKTAEREQLRAASGVGAGGAGGREERTLKKKKSFQFSESKFKFQPMGTNDRHNVENFSNGLYKSVNSATSPTTRSALSASLLASAPQQDEMMRSARGSDASFHSTSSLGQYSINHSTLSFTKGRYGGSAGGFQPASAGRSEGHRPTSSLGHYRTPSAKSGIAFELSESAMISSGGTRTNPRSKRVMKKKTSVITLSGNVQGRREKDGMIHVTVAPAADPWRAS